MQQDVTFTSSLLQLLAGNGEPFLSIILLSLEVTITAVTCAGLVGLPLGAGLALVRFRGRTLVIVLVNTLMGFPPVVAGLKTNALTRERPPWIEEGYSCRLAAVARRHQVAGATSAQGRPGCGLFGQDQFALARDSQPVFLAGVLD